MAELKQFTERDAWTLGNIAFDKAAEHGYPIVIDIRQGDTKWFTIKLPGATDTNLDWARRKRNLVLLTKESSWFHSVNRANGNNILETMNLDENEYAAHGGCIPIKVNGEMVATFAISGLPQKEDHDLAVECLEEFAKQQAQQ